MRSRSNKFECCVCELCNKSFASRAALSLHLMWVRHNRKLPVISDISDNVHAESPAVPYEPSQTCVTCVVQMSDVSNSATIVESCL